MNTTFEEIAKLENNWNGYGADPISPEIISRARDFYEQSNINFDFMAPTAAGTIQFENENNICYTEIEIDLDDFHLYIADQDDRWSYNGNFLYQAEDYLKAKKIIDFFNSIPKPNCIYQTEGIPNSNCINCFYVNSCWEKEGSNKV